MDSRVCVVLPVPRLLLTVNLRQAQDDYLAHGADSTLRLHCPEQAEGLKGALM